VWDFKLRLSIVDRGLLGQRVSLLVTRDTDVRGNPGQTNNKSIVRHRVEFVAYKRD